MGGRRRRRDSKERGKMKRGKEKGKRLCEELTPAVVVVADAH